MAENHADRKQLTTPPHTLFLKKTFNIKKGFGNQLQMKEAVSNAESQERCRFCKIIFFNVIRK